MALTYFKRFRMEIGLARVPVSASTEHPPYRFVPWQSDLLGAHAEAKYRSFCFEIDANVFPCLGDREGCLRLMRDITRRDNFLPQATWLVRVEDSDGETEGCGTIQGVVDKEGLGAVQNLGIVPSHRGRGLGTRLLQLALEGFRRAGLRRAYLEVTAQNLGALRLYQRFGFRTVRTVYKASQAAFA